MTYIQIELSAEERTSINHRIWEAIAQGFPIANSALDLYNQWPSPRPSESFFQIFLENPLDALLKESGLELFLSIPHVLSSVGLKLTPQQIYGAALATEHERLSIAPPPESTSKATAVAVDKFEPEQLLANVDQGTLAAIGALVLKTVGNLFGAGLEAQIRALVDKRVDEKLADVRREASAQQPAVATLPAKANVQKLEARTIPSSPISPISMAAVEPSIGSGSLGADEAHEESGLRRRWDQIVLADFVFLKEHAPTLAPALQSNAGIKTKADLVKAIIERYGVVRSGAGIVVDYLEKGLVVNLHSKETVLKETIANVVAIAGLAVEDVFGKYLVDIKAQNARQPVSSATKDVSTSIAVIPRKPKGGSSALVSFPFLVDNVPDIFDALPKGKETTRAELIHILLDKHGISRARAEQIMMAVLAGDVVKWVKGQPLVKDGPKQIATALGLEPEKLFAKVLESAATNRGAEKLPETVTAATDDEVDSGAVLSIAKAFQQTDRPTHKVATVTTAILADISYIGVGGGYARNHLKLLLDVYDAQDPPIKTVSQLVETLARKGYENFVGSVLDFFSGKIEVVLPNGATPHFTPAAVAMSRVIGQNPKVVYADILARKGYTNGGAAVSTTNTGGSVISTTAVTATAKQLTDNVATHRATAEPTQTIVSDAVNLLTRLGDAFPLFAQSLKQKNITTVEALTAVIPATLLGDRADFIAKMTELAESREQYDYARGKLKVIAQILQASLGAIEGKPLFEDKAVLDGLKHHHDTRQDFAKLVRRRAGALVGFPRRDAGKHEFNALLVQKMNREGPRERGAKISQFMKLFTGETLPVIGAEFTTGAAKLIDIMQLTSVEVVAAIPELDCNMLYTDVVRKNFPNLVMAMQRDGIFTVSGLRAKAGKALTQDIEMALVVDFNGNDPDAVRKCIGLPLMAEILAAPMELLLAKHVVTLPVRHGLLKETARPALMQ